MDEFKNQFGRSHHPLETDVINAMSMLKQA
jgi:hypothetical protein